MKFFTHQWWLDTQKGVFEDRHTAYADHVGRIRRRVPTDLLDLDGKLHDATVTSIECNSDERWLTFFVDGDREGELLQMRLTYHGVKGFTMTPNPDLGLLRTYGFGDLGYDEVDIDDTGALVHRLLFATGIEVEVRFNAFEYRENEAASDQPTHH